MRVSIRAKILIIFAATVIATSALNLFLISQILEKDYKSELHSELLILGSNLQTQLERITSLGIATRDIEGFSEQCRELIKKNKHIIQAMVIDGEGTIIFHNDSHYEGKKLTQKVVLSSITAGKTEIHSIKENNKSTYFAVLPFGDKANHYKYAVVICSPTKIINDKIFELINKCNVVLISSFGLAAVLLLIGLTMMLTSPLAVILNTMKDITKSRNLEKRVDIKTHDEIGQIADAFNTMTADLQQSTTSVDNLNREIAERKKAEEEIKKSRKLLQDMLDAMPFGVMVVGKDKKIRQANVAARRLTGYSENELVGHLCHQTLCPADENNCPILDQNQIIDNSERKLVTKDGKEVPILKSVVQLELGDEDVLLEAFVDITARKKAEHKLKESEKRFQEIVGNASEWVWEVDANGLYTYSSPVVEDLLGYKPEEVVGKKHFYDLFATEDRDEAKRPAFEKFSEKQAFKGFLNVNVHKNGQAVWLMTSGVPILDDDGNLVGYRGSDIDITQQKQAEETMKRLNRDLESTIAKLGRANNELKDFVYIASHDLREPLRKISAFGEILSASLKDNLNDDDKENFRFMIDGAKRMQQMIDALLTYSRVTTRGVAFEMVDLNQAVKELCEVELAVKIEETGAKILVPEQLHTVNGDPAQVRQLMQNLIANGLKYQKKGTVPQITIRSGATDNDMVRVEIMDNGIGIKQEQFKNIFVMFRRLHSRQEYEGSGIGLAVCKKIVERHGGDVGVSSTYDQGSTFWFTLPAQKPSEEKQAQLVASCEAGARERQDG